MAEALAHATDRKGRRVVDAAVQPVKLALQRRLLYLGPSKPLRFVDRVDSGQCRCLSEIHRILV